jgi:hypothetical protein
MSELLRVATLGTAPQRLILVRSRNRVIAMAAINSPKMLASDAERVAESAAVSEDVLRSIAGRRDWLGQRPMIRAKLCRNPKTPLHASIAQLPFLRDADLKALARSKNVPQALKSAVNQLVAKRAPRT